MHLLSPFLVVIAIDFSSFLSLIHSFCVHLIFALFHSFVQSFFSSIADAISTAIIVSIIISIPEPLLSLSLSFSFFFVHFTFPLRSLHSLSCQRTSTVLLQFRTSSRNLTTPKPYTLNPKPYLEQTWDQKTGSTESVEPQNPANSPNL